MRPLVQNHRVTEAGSQDPSGPILTQSKDSFHVLHPFYGSGGIWSHQKEITTRHIREDLEIV